LKPHPRDAAVQQKHQPKERAMKKIEERQSAEKAIDPSKFTKSQSLRADDQAIRTLTGAELRLVGGGLTEFVITKSTDQSSPKLL
jgi:hypothetical protein